MIQAPEGCEVRIEFFSRGGEGSVGGGLTRRFLLDPNGQTGFKVFDFWFYVSEKLWTQNSNKALFRQHKSRRLD